QSHTSRKRQRRQTVADASGSLSPLAKLLFPHLRPPGKFARRARPREGRAMPTTAPLLNYWPDTRCARAFWGQQHLPPYRKLLADTVAWLNPRPGERWLDLGCGSGQLTRAVWEASGGTVAEVVATDCAATNERSVAKLYNLVQPRPAEGQLRFVHKDFSH